MSAYLCTTQRSEVRGRGGRWLLKISDLDSGCDPALCCQSVVHVGERWWFQLNVNKPQVTADFKPDQDPDQDLCLSCTQSCESEQNHAQVTAR